MTTIYQVWVQLGADARALLGYFSKKDVADEVAGRHGGYVEEEDEIIDTIEEYDAMVAATRELESDEIDEEGEQ
jgi:hypothetical protein